jgi:hypothetical protein
MGWLEERILVPSGALETAAIERIVRPRRTSGGQGRGLDAESRRAVELRAMAVTRQALEAAWPSVQDVSARESFDFLCKAPGRELRVEVKGTVGAGLSVALTPNEIEVATRHHPDTALYVIFGIALESTGSGVIGRGGEVRRFEPWNPAAHRIEAVAFQCFLEPTDANRGARPDDVN